MKVFKRIALATVILGLSSINSLNLRQNDNIIGNSLLDSNNVSDINKEEHVRFLP